MKNKILILISMLSIAAFVMSCSDDSDGGGTEPEEKEDVVYFDGSVSTYVYDEYDLDTNNVQIASTKHQDSLAFVQETQVNSKDASEYSAFTNINGTYENDSTVYLSSETNKMYVHLTVLQKLFGNIDAEGFSLETFFNQIGKWYLIADNKAESWVLHDGTLTYNLPTLGETDGDVIISMNSDGDDAITIDGETIMADKYQMTMNIKSILEDFENFELDISVTANFWVAPNIGLVKSNINSFKLPVLGLWIEGTESMLVRYNNSSDEQ